MHLVQVQEELICSVESTSSAAANLLCVVYRCDDWRGGLEFKIGASWSIDVTAGRRKKRLREAKHCVRQTKPGCLAC